MKPTIPIILERENVNDESVTLVRWFVGQGERVELETLIAEVETSKANMEVFSPAAGFLVQAYPAGAEVPVSAAIGHITVEPGGSDLPSIPTSDSVVTPAVSRESAHSPSPLGKAVPARLINRAARELQQEFVSTTEVRQRFSPVAAKMLELHGLKATDFPGKSVVRKRDVLELLNPPVSFSDVEMTGSAQLTHAHLCARISQPYRESMLSKMKQREGNSLAAGVRNAVSSAVSVTCFTRGMRRIVETRMAGGSASAVIAYEVSRLLRKYPRLNATYSHGAALEYEQVNLGYAMNDGRGLKVAVLQNCDRLSLQEVSAQMRELTLAYLDDKLRPAQIANATFTISDLSGMGVSSFFPLISENQGGILGVGGEQFAPGASDGFYTLTLTFDHQLSDGRTAAQFLNDLKERLASYEGTFADEQLELQCSRCGRTAAELHASKQILLRSVAPESYVCTLCVAGY